MVTKTSQLLKKMKQEGASFEPKQKIGVGYIPNHSGDHSAGRMNRDPSNAKDLVNKDYVDDQFPVTHASTTGKTTDDHHAQSHTVASHSDTSATGAELNTLTDDSMADALHRHSELSASDGSPVAVLYVNAAGLVHIKPLSDDNSHLYGGELTTEDLYIFANSADSRPAIYIYGNARVDYDLGSGQSLQFKENGVTYMWFNKVASKHLATADSETAYDFDYKKLTTGNGLFVTVDSDVLTTGSAIRVDGGAASDQTWVKVIKNPENSEKGRITGNSDIVLEKSKITLEGGFAIKLTNKTGANSVRGELVIADTVTASAVDLAGTTEAQLIGTFYEDGIADGSEAWIVVGGIAPYKLDGAGASALGDRLVSSTITNGRAEVNNAPAAAAHFTECGHVLTTAAANGVGLMACHYL